VFSDAEAHSKFLPFGPSPKCATVRARTRTQIWGGTQNITWGPHGGGLIETFKVLSVMHVNAAMFGLTKFHQRTQRTIIEIVQTELCRIRQQSEFFSLRIISEWNKLSYKVANAPSIIAGVLRTGSIDTGKTYGRFQLTGYIQRIAHQHQVAYRLQVGLNKYKWA